jgi:TPR repeat protein
MTSFKRVNVMLTLAVLLATAAPTDTWHMGGGRAWMTPPKLGKERKEEELFQWFQQCGTKCRDEVAAREAARIQERARKGDVRAMRVTGFMLLNGFMLSQDQPAAVGWFYEAAIRNDPVSMFVLGCAFQYGVGVPADQKLATFWRQRAAEKRLLGLCQ